MAMHHTNGNSYSPSISSSATSSTTPTTDSGPQSTASYLDDRSSIDTTPSRPISHHVSSSRASPRPQSRRAAPPPSYMQNYQPSSPANRTQPIPISGLQARAVATPEPALAQRGLLLLALAADPPTSMIYYLSILLKRHAYSEIVIVGSPTRDSAIKQLKNDIYGLVGGLKMQIGVSTHTNARWDEEGGDLAATTQEALEGEDPIGAVVCTPEYDGVEGDLLTLDSRELARSWMLSVGFVHAVARSAIPRMTTDDNAPAVFAVLASTAHSPAALVNKAATNTLVRQLDISYASARGLAIGLAEQILVPDPEPVEEVPVAATPVQGNYAEPEFKPSESPTRLWNMWALQDELGRA